MKVIGIFGYIGAGKDAVAVRLEEKYGYKNYSYGDLVRSEASRLGNVPDRAGTQKTRQFCDAKYGKEYFPKSIVEKIIADKCEKAIISGIRNPEDAIVPKKFFGKDMLLIFIDADKKKRYERLKKRKREGDPSSLAAFRQQERRELQIFDYKSTEKLCDVVIKNNSTLKFLEKQVDEFVKTRKL